MDGSQEHEMKIKIYTFLRDQIWSEVKEANHNYDEMRSTEGRQGITWLELLSLYHIRNKHHNDNDRANNHTPSQKRTARIARLKNKRSAIANTTTTTHGMTVDETNDIQPTTAKTSATLAHDLISFKRIIRDIVRTTLTADH